jgi:hypothetical protein
MGERQDQLLLVRIGSMRAKVEATGCAPEIGGFDGCSTAWAEEGHRLRTLGDTGSNRSLRSREDMQYHHVAAVESA